MIGRRDKKEVAGDGEIISRRILRMSFVSAANEIISVA